VRRLAVALALALGALAPLVGPGAARAAGPGVVGCGAASLAVTYRGTTGGLAGSFGDLLWVTNVGHAACTLRGYAMVSFEAHGRAVTLASQDRRGHRGNDAFGVAPGRRVPWVRLAGDGGRASFWLFGSDILTPCRDLTTLVVSLPGTSGRASLPAPSGFTQWWFCGDLLWVNPIVGGDSGSLPPQSLSHLLMS
jgi:uncharacterized protein DUF4232